MNEISARRGVVDACRRAARERLVVGTAGNASQRFGDRVAVTATGAVLEDLTEDQVVVVDLDGHLLDGDFEPTSELELHLGLYRAETRIAAVMHTHAPVSAALSTVLEVLPVVHYQQLLLGGDVRVAPYSIFGSDRLALDVQEALAGRQAALMANHGAVAVAAGISQALDHALLLEWLCTLYRDACAVGTPRALDEQQQREVVEAALARSYGTLRPTSSPEQTS